MNEIMLLICLYSASIQCFIEYFSLRFDIICEDNFLRGVWGKGKGVFVSVKRTVDSEGSRLEPVFVVTVAERTYLVGYENFIFELRHLATGATYDLVYQIACERPCCCVINEEKHIDMHNYLRRGSRIRLLLFSIGFLLLVIILTFILRPDLALHKL